MAYERIDETKTFDGKTRDSHELRYRIAAGFIYQDDTVLDIGCGVGYGEGILKTLDYIGIDRTPEKEKHLKIDLEIIEHLNMAGVRTLIETAKQARKWIIVSTPIVPNSNPYHKQHFGITHILDFFIDKDWRQYGLLKQDNERYGIFIFKRVK